MGVIILVKGMTRRVVVVKSPDKRLFEEAVFFLCDNAGHGVSSDQIVAEAQAIADSFTRDSFRVHGIDKFRTLLWAVIGAFAASLIWASVMFIL